MFHRTSKKKHKIFKLGGSPPEWTTPDAVHSKCGETGANVATRSKDGDTGTYWNHEVTCFHWIIFDMGETKDVTQIRLFQGVEAWGGQYDDVEVFVSDDPEDFGANVWKGNLYGTGWVESGEFEKSGRYIKLLCYDDNDPYDRMYEFMALVA